VLRIRLPFVVSPLQTWVYAPYGQVLLAKLDELPSAFTHDADADVTEVARIASAAKPLRRNRFMVLYILSISNQIPKTQHKVFSVGN
jgi:hypothetical protein